MYSEHVIRGFFFGGICNRKLPLFFLFFFFFLTYKLTEICMAIRKCFDECREISSSKVKEVH